MVETLDKELFASDQQKSDSVRAEKHLLIADLWEIFDDTQPNESAYRLNFENYFFDLEPECSLALKMNLLDLPSVRIVDKKIFCKRGIFASYVSNLHRVAEALRDSGFSRLADINDKTLETFYISLLNPSDKAKCEDSIRARSTIKHTIKFLELLSYYHASTPLPDAPKVHIDEDGFLAICENYISERTDYIGWLDGGDFGGLPVECGLVLLDEALQEVQETNTKAMILGLYDACIYFLESSKDFRNLSSVLRGFFNKDWRIDDKGAYLQFTRKRKSGNTFIYKNRRSKNSKKFHFAQVFFDSYCNHGGDIEGFYAIKPKDRAAMDQLIRTKIYACSVIVFTLTGARSSEVFSLKRSSFKKDPIGNVTFTSSVKKTNHSIETERVVAEVAFEAVKFLNMLHCPSPYTAPASDKLFEINVPWKFEEIISGINWDAQTKRKEWCEMVLSRRLSDVDFQEIALNPHAFRHLFAEFALRRFDGNVREALRQHFRHSYKSWMTNDYIKNKLKLNAPKINKEYMRELLGRAAFENETLFGPVGQYIVNVIGSMRIVSDEDLEKLLEEFEIIEVHEYSYCMIRKADKTQAKCFDKATGSPIYANAKFEKCGACVGSLRLPSHYDAIKRIGMRENEVLHSRERNGLSALTQKSKNIIKLCETALCEMEQVSASSIKKTE